MEDQGVGSKKTEIFTDVSKSEKQKFHYGRGKKAQNITCGS